jgi:hypothetical protein
MGILESMNERPPGETSRSVPAEGKTKPKFDDARQSVNHDALV